MEENDWIVWCIYALVDKPWDEKYISTKDTLLIIRKLLEQQR